MKTLILVSLIFLTLTAEATTGSIIQVTRKLRMSANETLPPKDYFLDLGQRNGVKVGDVYEVTRQIPITNAFAGGAWHLMKVTLGEVKIYAVGESTSVGRVEVERDPSSLPAMEYQSFMIGDGVQLKTNLPTP